MLENERIIVQDRGGIDAGIAALMQNANSRNKFGFRSFSCYG